MQTNRAVPSGAKPKLELLANNLKMRSNMRHDFYEEPQNDFHITSYNAWNTMGRSPSGTSAPLSIRPLPREAIRPVIDKVAAKITP
jgi:hypothetical protein